MELLLLLLVDLIGMALGCTGTFLLYFITIKAMTPRRSMFLVGLFSIEVVLFVVGNMALADIL